MSDDSDLISTPGSLESEVAPSQVQGRAVGFPNRTDEAIRLEIRTALEHSSSNSNEDLDLTDLLQRSEHLIERAFDVVERARIKTQQLEATKNAHRETAEALEVKQRSSESPTDASNPKHPNEDIIAAKDQLLSTIRSALRRNEAEIAHLQHTTASQTQEITRLHEVLTKLAESDREKFEAVLQATNEKSELVAANVERDKRIAELEEMAKQKSFVVVESEKIIQGKDRRMKELEGHKREGVDQVLILRGQLDAQVRENARLRDAIDELRGQVSALSVHQAVARQQYLPSSAAGPIVSGLYNPAQSTLRVNNWTPRPANSFAPANGGWLVQGDSSKRPLTVDSDTDEEPHVSEKKKSAK